MELPLASARLPGGHSRHSNKFSGASRRTRVEQAVSQSWRCVAFLGGDSHSCGTAAGLNERNVNRIVGTPKLVYGTES